MNKKTCKCWSPRVIINFTGIYDEAEGATRANVQAHFMRRREAAACEDLCRGEGGYVLCKLRHA